MTDRHTKTEEPTVEQAPNAEAVEQAPVTEPAEESLEERLHAAEAKAEEHLNDLKRLAAEFDNYRKRVARDQDSLVARAHERLMKELLPVLDDLGRALEAVERPVRDSGPGEGARGNREVPQADAEDRITQLVDGVKLVHRSLRSALEREGLAEIPTDGRFDPHVHEALLAQPSEAEEGSVIQVLQTGYRLGDRVLRPARVVVSAGAAAERPVREAEQGKGLGNREVSQADAEDPEESAEEG